MTAAAKLEQASSAADSESVRRDPRPRGPRRHARPSTSRSPTSRELAITYASASKDEVTTRTIRPLRLLTIDGVSYLEAYCLTAEAYRTFRLDRVLSAAAGQRPCRPTTAAPRPIARSRVMPAVPTRTATLRLAPEARWIIDVHRRDVVGDPTRTASSTVDPAAALRGLGSRDWCSPCGAAAVVVDPPELVCAVAGAAEAALSAYPDLVQ